MEKIPGGIYDRLPLRQMQEQSEKYRADKANLIQAGGVEPKVKLMDQDEYRKAKGIVPHPDYHKYNGYTPPLSPEFESDIEKFVGSDREPVSDTVKYRKPISEAQWRISDWTGKTKFQESIQKGGKP